MVDCMLGEIAKEERKNQIPTGAMLNTVEESTIAFGSSCMILLRDRRPHYAVGSPTLISHIIFLQLMNQPIREPTILALSPISSLPLCQSSRLYSSRL